MKERDLTYKIIILEILWRANDVPLTATQITDFFTENEMTDYFTVQDAIGSLLETGNIETVTSANRVFYRINAKGRETLALFPDRITGSIRERILFYLQSREVTIREENSLIGDYYESGTGYVCHLQKTNGTVSILDLSFHVSDKLQAQAICANWKIKANEVYDSLMDILVN